MYLIVYSLELNYIMSSVTSGGNCLQNSEVHRSHKDKDNVICICLSGSKFVIKCCQKNNVDIVHQLDTTRSGARKFILNAQSDNLQN